MNLKNIRKNVGKTQEQIAKETNISKQTYQNYELGKREPNIEMLKKLADYYNVSLDELVGRKKEEVNLTEKKLLIKKLDELTEIECKKLRIFADGLISNRVEDNKEKTLKIIKDE